MANAQELEQDGFNFASRAVQSDQSGLVDTAIFYYSEAGQALITAHTAGSQIPDILEKATQYLARAEQLKSQGLGASAFAAPAKTPQQLEVERAKFLLTQAFEEDENGNKEEALELYMQAAEKFLPLRQQSSDTALQAKITNLAEQAVERAEQIKKAIKGPPKASPQASPKHQGKTYGQDEWRLNIPGPLGFALRDGEDESTQRAQFSPGPQAPGPPAPGPPAPAPGGGSLSAPVSVGSGSYTKEEIQVLKTTSMINGREYVPFMSVDMKERFGYPVPFSDRDGKLALSPKQRERFGSFSRPDEFCDNPQMIYAVSSFSIRQTVISDCSFVASLAISAQYERRFKKKLITSIVYPQNKNGHPVYNPCGKYMVKLNLNGVTRKVIIDDFLPMSRSSELLCSYSNNRNELWVSLLEKAYMKVMGGYDFPGSNSNIDLHALTGWIPERVAIRPGSSEFDADKEFTRILDRFHKGHCLVTLATGEIKDGEADRAGLVPTHAYAMLDIRQLKGFKLFQLKNPWSHLRWHGNWSEKDTQHWTAEMKTALNFDPQSAGMVDNGVFWIDYESVMKYFDVVYINWNPDLFSHTTCMHHTWTAKAGPKKDSYNIGDNPQFRLEVKAPGPSAVWILLTRHITDKDDFANNREFITVLVYKSNGKRVFYPYDPPPYKDGVRINSPHYLCKFVQEKGSGLYTLAISQYEKNNTLHYTIRVYATCEFKLNKISEPYNPSYEKQITGQWKGRTAGGCGNFPETHSNNPIYQIKIDNNSTLNQLLIELRGPKQYSVGFTVTCVSENVPNSPGSFKKNTSGDFRRGFCCLELQNIPGGVYNVMSCTFYAKQEGPFFLNISTSTPITVVQLQ